MQPSMVDHMAEAVYLLGIQLTFLLFEVELELADFVKYE